MVASSCRDQRVVDRIHDMVLQARRPLSPLLHANHAARPASDPATTVGTTLVDGPMKRLSLSSSEYSKSNAFHQ